ncbi:hypothetical protein KIH27_16275 [Mycobacterium sp. M1]|uniref:Outer membrane protein assembly factor BamB n=1 Tax=Mycolicibacter acidiphilus TaxID=2835306 RepID=A0ABS5RQA3_9MYCO|nr:PQQ-binding-like beta-propeller repeat protein [Mycolicibacter acidiphilus]MBS9535144.1 hypothetical protein [Mycolicibacter acidiphilus]
MTYPAGGYPPNNDPFREIPPAWHTPGNSPFGNPQAAGGYPYGSPPPPPDPTPQRTRTALVAALAMTVVVLVAGAGVLAWKLTPRDDDAPPTVAAAPVPVEPAAPVDARPRPSTSHLVPSLEQPPAAPRWVYAAGGSGKRYPFVAGGNAAMVIVATDVEGVIALDAATGAPLWPRPALPAGADPQFYSGMQCAIDRASTTVACGFVAPNGQNRMTVFFDATTGREKSHTAADGDNIYRVGDGFVVTGSNSATGYRADGTQIWKLDTDSPLSVYGDQGIAFLYHDVVDATTGEMIVRDVKYSSYVVHTTGFALFNEYTDIIDFYDFTGKKLSTIAGQGFKLARSPDWSGPERTHPGAAQPIAFNGSSGEIRGLDGLSGRVVWSEHTREQLDFKSLSYPDVTAVDQTCFFYVSRSDLPDNLSRVKMQTCSTESANPFVDIAVSFDYLAGSDGQRMLLRFTDDARCVDSATGRELWRTDQMTNPRWVGNGVYASRHKEVVRWF